MKKNVNNSEMNVQETMKSAQNAIYLHLVDGKDFIDCVRVEDKILFCVTYEQMNNIVLKLKDKSSNKEFMMHKTQFVESILLGDNGEYITKNWFIYTTWNAIRHLEWFIDRCNNESEIYEAKSNIAYLYELLKSMNVPECNWSKPKQIKCFESKGLRQLKNLIEKGAYYRKMEAIYTKRNDEKTIMTTKCPTYKLNNNFTVSAEFLANIFMLSVYNLNRNEGNDRTIFEIVFNTYMYYLILGYTCEDAEKKTVDFINKSKFMTKPINRKDLFRIANVNYNFMICDEIYGDYLAYLEENIMKKSK